jgi:transposase
MALYCGIDLHATNHLVVVIDDKDRRVLEKRLANDVSITVDTLGPYRDQLAGIAVESTFNWYWLIDGLEDAGFVACLANPAAIKHYEGLKHTDDPYDAFFLAHLMRLGILPTGYIYPREQRGVRDLLRRRLSMVQMATRLLLAVQSQVWRSTGINISNSRIRRPDFELPLKPGPVHEGAVAQWRLFQQTQAEIHGLERLALDLYRGEDNYQLLQTVKGIGRILGLTIGLETGSISRFRKAGNYASYCRCVSSQRISNGKKKGENNRKAGNRYLSWAFSEAAHFAVRFEPKVQRFYERKRQKCNGIVAIRAVAHKLSRAVFHMLKHHEPFDVDRAFG